MRFITRDTDYALRALIFMSKALKKDNKEIVTAEDIVRSEKLPKVFLRRILQKMAEKKMLSSHKGKSGGFSFLAQPREISLADVIRIFQGEIDLTNCFLKTRICPNRSMCSIRKKIRAINSNVTKELSRINLEELSS
jgi:Rrf2 family protein